MPHPIAMTGFLPLEQIRPVDGRAVSRTGLAVK